MPGTCSSGISTPRSPRATISASARSRISSSRFTACGFSIFAITAARPRVIFLASAMSSGRWMKDSATQSMPASSAASRSERSFVRQRRERDHGVGQAHALAVGQIAADLDPRDDLACRRPRSRSGAPCRRRAAAHGRARSRAKISGCGRCTRVALPGAVSAIEDEGVAFRQRHRTVCECPTRSFGPCRSTRIPIGRPNSALRSSGSVDTSSRMRSCEVWLMLMRKTSAPARNNARDHTERSEDDGPSVATILVRRWRRISSCGPGVGGGEVARPVGDRRRGVNGTRDCSGVLRRLVGRIR